jgi:ABC-type glycerol-3-phosphate transport system permease component
MLSKKVRRTIRLFVIHGSLIVISIWSVFPIAWIVVSAFKPLDRLFTYPPRWIPESFYLENFKAVFTETSFPLYILNSVIISGIATIAVVILSSLAAYAFTRFRFMFKNTLLVGILGMQAMPPLALIIALFFLMDVLKLLNTYFSLIFPYITMTLPLGIWLLVGFFQSVPLELEQAARVDGCSRIGFIFRILLPLSVPGLAAVTVLTFVICWNEFILALTFISSEKLRVFQVGLFNLIHTPAHQILPYGLINAVGVLGLVPVVIGYFLVSKYFIAGLTGGAIKG